MKLREFLPGEKVLLLVPSSDTKLLARWQGPYEIKRRLGKVDYEIETPDKRDKTKIFHVNLLKRWKDRVEGTYVGEDLEPEVRETVNQEGKGEMGGPPPPPQQKKDLSIALGQFKAILSPEPGKTDLVQHRITIKGEKVIRLPPPRRWPKHLEEDLIKEVQGMRDLGVIEPSNSEWRSYPVMVPKPDGKVRVCIISGR